MGDARLLRSARFAPFFWTQLLGAVNDNLFKNGLVILFAFGTVGAGLSADTLVNLAGGIYIFPFFLFSATAGQLADKLEKSRIVRAVKLLEIAIMTFGTAGFVWRSPAILLTALFLMGVHSTVFGPVKYGILPQLLRDEELIAGNAFVEAGTFVAILVGTILGGVIVSLGSRGPALVGVAAIVVAVAGWLASRGIPLAAAAAPELRVRWNPFTETVRSIALARKNLTIFRSILGISWFWFLGALLLAQFPGLGHEVLRGDEHVVTVLLTVFAIGVGGGSLLCERLSGGAIELGLVPIGSVGLTVFALDLFFAARAVAGAEAVAGAAAFFLRADCWRIAADLILLGTSGGLFIVPLLALVQHRSPAAERARVVAANNVVSAFFMVAAAMAGIGLRVAGLGIPHVFLAAAVVNTGVAVYLFTLIPEFLMRFLIFLLMHTVYRLRHDGLERVPTEGPAVIVCNHVSFVDALVITAACRRPIRFLIDHQIYRIPVLHFVFRTAHAIPIAPRKEDPALLERAYDHVARALDEGELVCIFPEGRLTKDGELAPFRAGVERILARHPVPVVPMALRGLWGSFFSRKDGAALRRPFRRVWSRVEIVCGAPVAPETATAEGLHTLVLGLRGSWR